MTQGLPGACTVQGWRCLGLGLRRAVHAVPTERNAWQKPLAAIAISERGRLQVSLCFNRGHYRSVQASDALQQIHIVPHGMQACCCQPTACTCFQEDELTSEEAPRSACPTLACDSTMSIQTSSGSDAAQLSLHLNNHLCCRLPRRLRRSSCCCSRGGGCAKTLPSTRRSYKRGWYVPPHGRLQQDQCTWKHDTLMRQQCHGHE